MLLQRGLVPLRAIFPSAANVGNDFDATALKPARANARAVVGEHRNFEPSVRIKQRGVGAIQRHIRTANHEVGDLGAVEARGKVLVNCEALTSEHGRLRLEHLGRYTPVLSVRKLEHVGHEEAIPPQPHTVILVGPDGRHRDVLANCDSTALLRRWCRHVGPHAPALVAPEAQDRANVLEHFQNEVVLRAALRRKRGRVGGREECRDVAKVGLHDLRHGSGQQRTGGKGLLASRRAPFGAQLDEGAVRERAKCDVVWHRHWLERSRLVRRGHAEVRGRTVPGLGGVERDRALLELMVEPAVVVRVLVRSDVRLLALEYGGGLAQRRAAAPRLDHARVAAVRERHAVAFEIRPDQHLVAGAVADPRLGGLRQRETPGFRLDERFVHHVELACGVGVGAAGRQRDQRAVPRTARPLVQERVRVPDPRRRGVDGGRRQRVHVDHRLPFGRGAAVGLERGLAPNALHVRLVPPEVVVPAVVADPGDARDFVF
mmetsp:Transcript_28032/g.57531  ORF Transcript_28032/g.57531 Transcript_28032/m.57531 type:complete len:488 (+) Transcript_28032:868-2331(+)